MRKSFRKTAQDIQDDIFRKMSADRKMEIGSQLWQLGKELVGNKIHLLNKNWTKGKK